MRIEVILEHHFLVTCSVIYISIPLIDLTNKTLINGVSDLKTIISFQKNR